MIKNKSRIRQEPIDDLPVVRRQVATRRKSDDLRKSLSLLSAVIESTADGILVVEKKAKSYKMT
jgi:hypothetical protein